MENCPTTVASVGSVATTSTSVAAETDLLLRLAQRGVALVAVDDGLDLAAGERDLAPVRRHGLGPAGEHEADLGVLLEQGEEHRGGATTRARAAADGGGT